MSENINSIIDLVHPTVSGVGIITTDQIWVLFDREIDETTVAAGNFFVTGLDNDTWSGPDLQLFLDRESVGEESEILQSPGYDGILQGTICFQRIALDSTNEVTTKDTVGSGLLYRTKAIITPTNRLAPNTEYEVYLSGDEDDTDTYNTGLSERTVFDPVASGGNIGSGTVEFEGGYIGPITEDVYRIAITSSGEASDARFTFVRDSDPFSVFGPFTTRQSGVLLSDGVTVSFDDGIFRTGDQWSVVAKERNVFTGNLYWPFKTGSGSIESLPTTTATSIIGDPAPVTAASSSSTTALSVSSTSPSAETSHLSIDPGEYTISATFNKDIDPLTISSGTSVTVYSESVTGETDVVALGTLIASPSATGSQLDIVVASGQLKQNNLVTVTLDSTIAATDGTALGSDYEFWFTTLYNPLYCSSRMVKVRVGAYITDVKNDTINLALHMASKEADMLTWNKTNLDDDYYNFVRQQWACCRAAQMLLINTVGGAGSIKSKKLGDLAVEYNTNADVSKPLSQAEDCLGKWEGALAAGGRQVQTPTMVIKGELDPDRPLTGRGAINLGDKMPASNSRIKLFGRRRWHKGWWNK